MEDNCQVATCAVLWHQEEKLILFAVPKGHFQQGELFRNLQECLPSYAVPDELLLIDTLPLTSHGKKEYFLKVMFLLVYKIYSLLFFVKKVIFKPLIFRIL